MILIDLDIVLELNLYCQVLYKEVDIGNLKVVCVWDWVFQYNVVFEVEVYFSVLSFDDVDKLCD